MAFIHTSLFSRVSGRIPPVSELKLGQIAVNTADGTLFVRKSANGVESVVEVGGRTPDAEKLTTARRISMTGDATGNTLFDGSADASINLVLASTGVAAGTYSKVVVNAKGLVTAAFSLNYTDVAGLDGRYARLGAANTFTQPQTIIDTAETPLLTLNRSSDRNMGILFSNNAGISKHFGLDINGRLSIHSDRDLSLGKGILHDGLLATDTTGILVRSANPDPKQASLLTPRIIAGTAGQLTVTNGNGLAGNPTIALDATGITPGTYAQVTVDAYGRVTAGSAAGPTSLDTLASVTGRGATTGAVITLTNATNSTDHQTGALIVRGGIASGESIVARSAVSVISPTASASLNLDAVATGTSQIQLRKAGLMRWRIRADGAAETGGGSNDGTNLLFSRYDDAGNMIDNPLTISRTTGIPVFTSGFTAQKSSMIDLGLTGGGQDANLTIRNHSTDLNTKVSVRFAMDYSLSFYESSLVALAGGIVSQHTIGDAVTGGMVFNLGSAIATRPFIVNQAGSPRLSVLPNGNVRVHLNAVVDGSLTVGGTTTFTGATTLTSINHGESSTVSSIVNGVTTTATVLDSFATTAIRGAKYLVTASASGAHEMSEIMVIHNSSNVFVNEHATVTTGAKLATYSAAVANGTVTVSATAASGTLTIRMHRTAIRS